MLSERDYMHPAGGHQNTGKNIVYILIAMNVIVFILLSSGGGGRRVLYEFALSSYGIKQFKIWQFVTYMFIHAGFTHIFFNMWGLYLFGMTILPILGTVGFLKLYFLSGISGAGLWLLANWNSPVPIVGASGAVFGVMMAAAMLHPNLRIQLLFPPIPMKMKTFVTVYAAIEIVSEFSNSRAGIAHLAHLGGFISAYWYIRSVYGDRVWDIFSGFRTFARRKKKKPSPPSKLPDGWNVYSNPNPLRPGSVSKEEVNRILDKISAHGIDSLTAEEKATLKKASGEMKH